MLFIASVLLHKIAGLCSKFGSDLQKLGARTQISEIEIIYFASYEMKYSLFLQLRPEMLHNNIQ
jgi:hypothetical protein